MFRCLLPHSGKDLFVYLVSYDNVWWYSLPGSIVCLSKGQVPQWAVLGHFSDCPWCARLFRCRMKFLPDMKA